MTSNTTGKPADIFEKREIRNYKGDDRHRRPRPYQERGLRNMFADLSEWEAEGDLSRTDSYERTERRIEEHADPINRRRRITLSSS
jgi:hypothetical protein